MKHKQDAEENPMRNAVLAENKTPAAIVEEKNQMEDEILDALSNPSKWYWVALLITVSMVVLGASAWVNQIIKGMGKSGLNNPVGWGVYITDFVFWVGIAHSGTLISAILYLFRAKFRSRFNRSAEAMTIFAVLTAGLFPIIHLGRVWFFYWLFPYPNERQIWVNFRSPLVLDVFAVSTYLTVSSIFFYVGLIPDIAIARKITRGVKKKIYGLLSLGWSGSFRQWQHYNQLYKFLAALAAPLVLSVHSVVSWDFAMGIVPGWHSTIFAPYFVAGAIFSGMAMVFTLVIPMRKIFRLEKFISVDHFEKAAQLLLFTAMIVTYAYIIELVLALYSGNKFEVAQFLYRMNGDYKFAYWLMFFCNAILPWTLFVKKLRRSIPYLWVFSFFVNIGMWLERFNIVVISLSKDFDPYAFGLYHPSFTEIAITIGSFGWFLTFFLIFTKTLPVLSVTEFKEEVK